MKEIANLTSTDLWELQVDLEDYAGKQYFARYHNFMVNNEKQGPYSLKLSGYDAANSTLIDSLSHASGAPFSTSDNDNDKWSRNCAAEFKGAWWYTACHSSNLNGYNYFIEDLPKNSTYYANGIVWRNENNVLNQDHYFSWPKVEMKIRKRMTADPQCGREGSSCKKLRSGKIVTKNTFFCM